MQAHAALGDTGCEELVEPGHDALVAANLEGPVLCDRTDALLTDIARDYPGKGPPQIGGKYMRLHRGIYLQRRHIGVRCMERFLELRLDAQLPVEKVGIAMIMPVAQHILNSVTHPAGESPTHIS